MHIGANVMVLHMQLPFREFEKNESNMKDYYRQVYRSFDEIQGYAKAAGVKNCSGEPSADAYEVPD